MVKNLLKSKGHTSFREGDGELGVIRLGLQLFLDVVQRHFHKRQLLMKLLKGAAQIEEHLRGAVHLLVHAAQTTVLRTWAGLWLL